MLKKIENLLKFLYEYGHWARLCCLSRHCVMRQDFGLNIKAGFLIKRCILENYY